MQMQWLKGAGTWVCLLLMLTPAFISGCGGSAQADNSRQGASDVIENKGSDTLVNLALAWAEEYAKEHPEASISVTGGGTGTGIAAMLNGTVDIANASRAMKDEEIKSAKEKGLSPTEFTVAGDAIAIIINPANPVSKLTMQQLSDMYTGKITNWQQVGGADRPVVLLSRESNSGTYTYFLEHVVRMGDSKSKLLFSPDTLLMPSSEGIGAEVRQNPNAIGYDGLGYVTPDMKTVAVAKAEAGPFVLPSKETVLDRTYPVARPLFMYTPVEPSGVIRDYLDWILTDGQKMVAEMGFVPIE